MKALALALVVLGDTAGPEFPRLSTQDQTVKLGTLAPEGSPWHGIIRDMAEDWKKAADGKIQFRIYPGGVAGDEPVMIQKMKVGQLHAAALTGVGLAEIAPEIMALQMPMMLQSYEELDYVVEKTAPRFEKILKDKGYTVLNWGDAGWVTFFADRPVIRPDDLKKVKLFIWATSTTEAALWKDEGVQPVPLAATEIHPSLKSGLINAFSTTPLAALSFQWFGSAKNMTDLKWAPLVGATVITNKKWDSIPEAQKPALVKAAKESGERLRRETRKLGADAVGVMQKHGLQVHPVPADALAEWEKWARGAWPRLMGKDIPQELVAEIEKLRDEARAKKKQG